MQKQKNGYTRWAETLYPINKSQSVRESNIALSIFYLLSKRVDISAQINTLCWIMTIWTYFVSKERMFHKSEINTILIVH